MTKIPVIILTTLAVPAPALCHEADTAAVAGAGVTARIALHDDMMRMMTGQPFDNPAMNQWRQSYSYSRISGGYSYSRDSRAVDARLGSGVSAWGAAASSYMKYKSSTLWGGAGYINGRQEDVRWNESSDAALIYPYFTADATGGDMQMERYSFEGGYADHNSRWAWGVAASYHAGLYYRNVDPRPRNTTGCLDISAGGGMRISSSDYYAGVSANYRKYKQSCDIEFVNELSDNSIWHLTGLGTHYERFAGNGYSHYYNGHRWGATADLFPASRRGAVASVAYSSFSFDHILTGLNKLPLQSATENRVSAMAGWLAPGTVHDFAAVASVVYARRTGTENIFGDPSGNVYPQIGALDLYTHTLAEVDGSVLWQWHRDDLTMLSVKPGVTWRRSNEKYADPRRRLLLSDVAPSVTVQGARVLGRVWHASLSVSFAASLPVENVSELPVDNKIPVSLQEVDINRYEILSKTNMAGSVSAGVSRALDNRYALELSASYMRRSYTDGIHSDYLCAAVSFIF